MPDNATPPLDILKPIEPHEVCGYCKGCGAEWLVTEGGMTCHCEPDCQLYNVPESHLCFHGPVDWAHVDPLARNRQASRKRLPLFTTE